MSRSKSRLSSVEPLESPFSVSSDIFAARRPCCSVTPLFAPDQRLRPVASQRGRPSMYEIRPDCRPSRRKALFALFRDASSRPHRSWQLRPKPTTRFPAFGSFCLVAMRPALDLPRWRRVGKPCLASDSLLDRTNAWAEVSVTGARLWPTWLFSGIASGDESTNRCLYRLD